MKKTNFLFKVLLCFLMLGNLVKGQNSQQVSNGNFELGETGVNNSDYLVKYGYGFEVSCNNTDFSEYSTLEYIYTNDFLDPATLIQINAFDINNPNNFDPQLLPFNIYLPKTNGLSQHSLKLNRNNEHNCGNCQTADSAILEKFIINPTEDFLSLNFAMVFSKPVGTNHVIARFEILDLNDNVLLTECIQSSNQINQLDLNIENVGSEPTLNYIDWTCITLDISSIKGLRKKTGKLRVIVNDFDKGNDTIMYLDDIGNNGSLCKTEIPCEDGSISMNKFSINCPIELFTISGSYELPTCDVSDPTNIKLELLPSNTGMSNLIDQNNFSNGTYSFTIDPSILDSSLEYDLIVTANFSDGSSASAQNPGKEITFKDCKDVPCVGDDCGDECDNYWVAILDEYIDGTQSGSNYVYLMANGNYPSGASYTWTTTRQNGLIQTYAGGDIILVDASINNRIVSAEVTVSFEDCTETVSKTFDCAIPNSDANGNLFPECNGNSGGGFGKSMDSIRIHPNPVKANSKIKIEGLESYDVDAIDVVDMFGNIKSASRQKSNILSIGNLNTGIYFIKISTKQGVIQKKIVVN